MASLAMVQLTTAKVHEPTVKIHSIAEEGGGEGHVEGAGDASFGLLPVKGCSNTITSATVKNNFNKKIQNSAGASVDSSSAGSDTNSITQKECYNLELANEEWKEGYNTNKPKNNDNDNKNYNASTKTSTTSVTQQQQHKSQSLKSLSFGYVSVRFYNTIVGDSPACSSGAPLSLGWDWDPSIAVNNVPVDTYEQVHPNRSRDFELVLSRATRLSRLLDAGNKRKDIAAATAANIADRNYQTRNLLNLKFQPYTEFVEGFSRATLRMLLVRSSNSWLYQEWFKSFQDQESTELLEEWIDNEQTKLFCRNTRRMRKNFGPSTTISQSGRSIYNGSSSAISGVSSTSLYSRQRSAYSLSTSRHNTSMYNSRHARDVGSAEFSLSTKSILKPSSSPTTGDVIHNSSPTNVASQRRLSMARSSTASSSRRFHNSGRSFTLRSRHKKKFQIEPENNTDKPSFGIENVSMSLKLAPQTASKAHKDLFVNYNMSRHGKQFVIPEEHVAAHRNGDGDDTSSSAKQPAIPFAIVNMVYKDSPCDLIGVEKGDAIVQFGPLDSSNVQSHLLGRRVYELVSIAQSKDNPMSIPMVIQKKRTNERIAYELTPKAYPTGPGYLGCLMSPYTATSSPSPAQ